MAALRLTPSLQCVGAPVNRLPIGQPPIVQPPIGQLPIHQPPIIQLPIVPLSIHIGPGYYYLPQKLPTYVLSYLLILV